MGAHRLKLPLYKVAIYATESTIDPDNAAPIGWSVFESDGEPLILSRPENVCEELMEICNGHYYATVKGAADNSGVKFLGYLSINIEPMARPDMQVLETNEKGKFVLAENQAYVNYRQAFRKEVMSQSATFYTRMPIKRRCQITAIIRAPNTVNKCLSQYVDAVVDCLEYSGVIRDKAIKTVNNTDGSRMYPDMNNPRTEIFIRAWGK